MASRRKIVQGVAGILLLLCAIAVTLDGRPRAAEGAPPTVQVREVFFGEREETVCQPGRREFVLDDLQGLSVCIVWSGLEGTYWTQLTFVSPDGHVYQKMTQAFVTPEARATVATVERSEEHTSELQSRLHLVCRLLLEKKNKGARWTDSTAR